MHWLVFGDDWGRHPSTTQHLIAHLPPGDSITWVDSLGLRPPRLALSDLRRIRERLVPTTSPPPTGLPPSSPLGQRSPDRLITPRILPWHLRALPLNRLLLRRAISPALAAAPPAPRPIALLANPVASLYADLACPSAVIYLRLDDWPRFPGVDPTLIAATEPRLLREADLVLAPNRHLLEGVTAPHAVLAQGVDLERFATPLDPPATRVLGYWGSIAPWLDQDLILAVARNHPDWTLELVGRPDTNLSRLTAANLPNLRILPPVPHDRLAAQTTHWRAAWAPFIRGDHIARSSSLKLREYLAAGFPTATPPHPEAASLPHITEVPDLDAVAAFLASTAADTPTSRAARRASVADQSWQLRATDLRAHASRLLGR